MGAAAAAAAAAVMLAARVDAFSCVRRSAHRFQGVTIKDT